MNFQQLEYLITQATLSMMIKKLEQELDVILFDRSKQPVIPTEAGKKVIEQARVILKETQLIRELSKEIKSVVDGELRVGIIPTLAPYLLPLFLPGFLVKYPLLKLRIQEQTTDQLIQQLSSDKIDVALMATPGPESNLKSIRLFYEEFRVFVAAPDKNLKKKYLLPEDIDINKLRLLQEGHCN